MRRRRRRRMRRRRRSNTDGVESHTLSTMMSYSVLANTGFNMHCLALRPV